MFSSPARRDTQAALFASPGRAGFGSVSPAAGEKPPPPQVGVAGGNPVHAAGQAVGTGTLVPPQLPRGKPRLWSQLDFGPPRIFLCFLTSQLLFLDRVDFLADVALFSSLYLSALAPSDGVARRQYVPFLPPDCHNPETPASPAPLPPGSAPSSTDAEAHPQPCLPFLASRAVVSQLITLFFLFLLIHF